MSRSDETTMRRDLCPPWCVREHGIVVGEDDWVHTGEPVVVTEEVTARPCMSIDPDTRIEDGPYVLIGSRQYTLNEAEALARSLIALVATVGAEPADYSTPRPGG